MPSPIKTPTPRVDAWSKESNRFSDEEVVLTENARTLETELAEAKAEIAAERNLHGQTRVVVEELNTICNDLRNAGQPQFIRSEAIRLLREDQAELRSSLAASQERVRELERVLAGLEALATGEGWNTPVFSAHFGAAVRDARALLKSNPANA